MQKFIRIAIAMCLLCGNYMVVLLQRFPIHSLEMADFGCRYRCSLLYWVVCEASQVAEAERGASLSVEATGGRGYCARIGKNKGQLAEEGYDKTPYGKGIS